MLPLALWLPAQAPEAAHALALVVDQVSVEGWPAGTFVGASDMLTVGIGVGALATVTLALLATPLQLRV